MVIFRANSGKFGRRRVAFAKSGALRSCALVWLLVFCCAAGWADSAVGASAPRNGWSAASVEMNLRFAIADFDGDQQADLATVQAGGGSSSQSRYWIRFELTSGNRQMFGVTGPVGGLQISPRDVNGDHVLDLVVSTAWLNQTIAILLNDGHGNFTLADPGEFPEAAPESQAEWSGKTAQIHENAAIPPSRSSARVCAMCVQAFHAEDSRELMPLSALRFHIRQLEFGCSDRAPPLAVLHV